MARYVELQVTSHFSFLRGASSPEQLFSAAALLGHEALGLADWGSVAGVVRGWDAQKATGVRMIAGTRLDLTDGKALLLYPPDRPAWSRMTRLLSLGKARGGKGCCRLDWGDVATHAEGQVAILLPDQPDSGTLADLADMRQLFGARAYMALSLRRRPDDIARLHELDAMARAAGVRSVATGDILYPKDFAERTFKQIEGFGSYGFPESHAASFAKIAYASSWMKHHHPDVFCAALLNAQPMGFYAPAQIVRDARQHGVEVRPVSINHSHWDCTLEPARGRYGAVRLGFARRTA
ncbi:hypothetical protein TomTYG45_22670 [Sphingobium sp. TomTYG45]